MRTYYVITKCDRCSRVSSQTPAGDAPASDPQVPQYELRERQGAELALVAAFTDLCAECERALKNLVLRFLNKTPPATDIAPPAPSGDSATVVPNTQVEAPPAQTPTDQNRPPARNKPGPKPKQKDPPPPTASDASPPVAPSAPPAVPPPPLPPVEQPPAPIAQPPQPQPQPQPAPPVTPPSQPVVVPVPPPVTPPPPVPPPPPQAAPVQAPPSVAPPVAQAAPASSDTEEDDGNPFLDDFGGSDAPAGAPRLVDDPTTTF